MAASNSEELDTSQFEPSFELLRAHTEIANLRRQVELQTEQLDERDALLNELGQELVARRGDQNLIATLRQNVEAATHESTTYAQEVVRLQALLEASSVERRELVAAAQRSQNKIALIEAQQLEAAEQAKSANEARKDLSKRLASAERTAAAQEQEHKNRAGELHELRLDAKRMSDIVAELKTERDQAVRRVREIEGLIERQQNEIAFLKRRITTLGEQEVKVTELTKELKDAEKESTLKARAIKRLETELEKKNVEAKAAVAAVDAIATDSAERSTLLAQIRKLKEEIDRLNDQGPKRSSSPASQAALIARAQTMGTARKAAKPAPVATPAPAKPASKPAPVPPAPAPPKPAAKPAPVPPAPAPPKPAAKPAPVPPAPAPPKPAAKPAPAPAAPPKPAAKPAPVPPAPAPAKPAAKPEPAPAPAKPAAKPSVSLAQIEKRLREPEAVCLVDARSACAQLRIDPVELLNRVERLRDHYRIPVHLIATPLATPRGGYQERHAIGIHQVEGSETIAEKLASLLRAFPHKPVVVVTADELVQNVVTKTKPAPLLVKPTALLDTGSR